MRRNLLNTKPLYFYYEVKCRKNFLGLLSIYSIYKDRFKTSDDKNDPGDVLCKLMGKYKIIYLAYF